MKTLQIKEVDNGYIVYAVVGASYNPKIEPIKVYNSIFELTNFIQDYYAQQGEEK